MSKKFDRRQFAKAGAAAAVAASLPTMPSPVPVKKNILGSSDSVRVGFIGVGNRGSQLMTAFAAQEDCKFVGVADLYQPYLDRARENHGNDYGRSGLPCTA
jgi:hypothetical protein